MEPAGCACFSGLRAPFLGALSPWQGLSCSTMKQAEVSEGGQVPGCWQQHLFYSARGLSLLPIWHLRRHLGARSLHLGLPAWRSWQVRMALPVNTKPWSQMYCTVAPTGKLGPDTRRRLCSTSPGSWQEVTEQGEGQRGGLRGTQPGPGCSGCVTRLYPLFLCPFYVVAVSPFHPLQSRNPDCPCTRNEIVTEHWVGNLLRRYYANFTSEATKLIPKCQRERGREHGS